jgi:hypothetical protein
MVLAFVHMLLHMLADKAEGSTTSFVAELCQTFGITGTPGKFFGQITVLMRFGIYKDVSK